MMTKSGAFARLAAALIFSAPVQAADDVHIWLRGFIPGSSEAVDTSPGVIVRASDGQCFGTDQRGWSEEPNAPARLSSDFHLLLPDNAEPLVRPARRTVTSAEKLRQLDCQSAQELAVAQTQLLANVVGTPSQADDRTQVSILAAVPDPQRPWSSATISYDATFTYDRSTRTLDYRATTGSFPAYEAYATLNDGPVITVFRSGPVHRSEAETATVELKGSVNLSAVAKRPKPPTNLTIQ